MSEIDFDALAAPFKREDILCRIMRAGEGDSKVWARVAWYVDARAVMDRLDEVVGPGNWRDEYVIIPRDPSDPKSMARTMCGLSLYVGDQWVTKWDGAEDTDIESVKGGVSGAFKRAAVKWSIGRYLYSLGEMWAVVNERGKNSAKLPGPNGTRYKWDEPQLPHWALPKDANTRKDNAQKAAEILEAIKGIMADWTDKEKDPYRALWGAAQNDIEKLEILLASVKERAQERERELLEEENKLADDSIDEPLQEADLF